MEKPKLKVKAILLDLDGTIVDSKEAYLEALRAASAETENDKIDPKAVTEIPKRLEQNLPIDDLINGIDAEKFLQAYLNAYYEATAKKAKPLSSVSSALEKLSKKTKLAVVTMRYVPKEKVREELRIIGLTEFFQHVITALDTYSPKPSPEPLIECAKQLDVDICECAVVGDSIVDIKAGKAAGAKTVAVLSGIFSFEELKREEPDLILESIMELSEFIE